MLYVKGQAGFETWPRVAWATRRCPLATGPVLQCSLVKHSVHSASASSRRKQRSPTCPATAAPPCASPASPWGCAAQCCRAARRAWGLHRHNTESGVMMASRVVRLKAPGTVVPPASHPALHREGGRATARLPPGYAPRKSLQGRAGQKKTGSAGHALCMEWVPAQLNTQRSAGTVPACPAPQHVP